VGDHAGSLIASMTIDLATKSSPEFEYTHEGPLFGDTSTFARVAIARPEPCNKPNLQKRGEIETIAFDRR